MEDKKIVCIVCPKGCRLKVFNRYKENDNYNDLQVTGNGCKRGVIYGIKEVVTPTRVITSTVRLNHPDYPRMPVVTKGAVPKELMFQVMEEINKVKLEVPVYMGDIVIENVLNSGVNIVASRTIA